MQFDYKAAFRFATRETWSHLFFEPSGEFTISGDDVLRTVLPSLTLLYVKPTKPTCQSKYAMTRRRDSTDSVTLSSTDVFFDVEAVLNFCVSRGEKATPEAC